MMALPARLTASLWYLVLAVSVTFPLLGSGRLFLLDYPSGPHLFDPVFFPLRSSGDLGNEAPLYLLLHELERLWSLFPDKLLMVAPIAVGGFGMDRLVRLRAGVGPLPGLYAGTLYAVNPFVRDRFLAGHLVFLLAYALLPYAISTAGDVLRQNSIASAVRAGAWFAGLAALDIHIALVFCPLLVLLPLMVRRSIKWRILLAGTASASAAALSAYWLVPVLVNGPQLAVGVADLRSYASVPHTYLVFPTLLSLHGFWRTEFVPVAVAHNALYVLLTPILALAASGAITLLSARNTRACAVLACGAVIAAVFLAGAASVDATYGIARWTFTHVPGMLTFREPQKLLVAATAAYAASGAVALERLRGMRTALALAATVCVLGYGAGLFDGLNRAVHLEQYPPGWSKAREAVDQRGAALALPWHLYSTWPFSGGRVVANPSKSYFGLNTLGSQDPGLPHAHVVDPFAVYVSRLLGHRESMTRFGAAIAPLGIRYVLLERAPDWREYRFLFRQHDLHRLLSTPTITVFENDAWSPSRILRLQPPASERQREHALLSGVQADRLFLPLPANVAVPDLFGIEPLGALVRKRTVPATANPFISVAIRCTDGWRADRDPGSCDLGAVSAFRGSNVARQLTVAADGLRILGYAVSAACTSALLLAALRNRRQSAV